MKQPKYGTALSLRRELPDVVLNMETDFLHHEAQQLGLFVSAKKNKKSARISILLSDRHSMIIRPIDRAAHGYTEWITFVQCPCPKEHNEYFLRVAVEIIDECSPRERRVESFTESGDSLDKVIRNALGAYELLTSKYVIPLFIADDNDENQSSGNDASNDEEL